MAIGVPVQQTPTPPHPGGHMAITDTFGIVAVAIVVLAILASAVAMTWPLIRAYARRLESGGHSSDLVADLDGLRTRVDQLESGQTRVAELEERLDFAERLLARTREPDRLQP